MHISRLIHVSSFLFWLYLADFGLWLLMNNWKIITDCQTTKKYEKSIRLLDPKFLG